MLIAPCDDAVLNTQGALQGTIDDPSLIDFPIAIRPPSSDMEREIGGPERLARIALAVDDAHGTIQDETLDKIARLSADGDLVEVDEMVSEGLMLARPILPRLLIASSLSAGTLFFPSFPRTLIGHGAGLLVPVTLRGELPP